MALPQSPPPRNVRLVISRALPSRSVAAFARVACLVLVTLPSCASSSPTPRAPLREHWVPGYVFGIWGTAELDVRDDCPTTGAAGVRVGATWSTVLVSLFTLGLYTPREVHVQCRERP